MRIVIVMHLLLLATVTWAQNHFTVVITHRCVTEQRDSIKPGQTLSAKNKVILTQGSYLGLLHTSGKLFEFGKAGIYSIDSLSKGLSTQQDSTYTQLLQYYIKVSDEKFIDARYKYFVTTFDINGGRGVGSPDNVVCPHKVSVYPSPIFLSWKWNVIKPPYRFQLLNMYDETVMDTTLRADSIVIQFTGKLYQQATQYEAARFSIGCGNTIHIGELYLLYALNDSTITQITAEISALQKINPKQRTLDLLFMGLYFEKKGLVLNALYYYHLAAIQNEGIYRKIYINFLKRNDLKKT